MQFNYQDYKKKEESKSTTTKKEWSEQPKVQFMSNFLKKDGDSIVVRFPYSTDADFYIEHCHETLIPGNPYPQKVECTKSSGRCTLCESNTKEVDRFLVKLIAYVINNNTNKVDLVPVVWDRPMKYADELSGKMTDYGDLRECLFKIKRNGTGQNTTYSTDIVTNKTIYKDDIYVKDFSSIEDLNPSFLLVRRMSKYLELIGEKPVEEAKSSTLDSSDVQKPEKETSMFRTMGQMVEGEVGLADTPTENPDERIDPTERRPIRRFQNIK